MKIPQTFVPEKDLGDATNSLLNPPKSRALEKLIFKDDSGFSNFVKCENLPAAKFYPLLAKSKIDEAVYVDYNNSIITDNIIDIVKFNDKNYLGKNKGKIKKIIKEYNSRRTASNLCALVKDEYLVFIYADYADADFKTKAVHFYKQKFGFEEVEQ